MGTSAMVFIKVKDRDLNKKPKCNLSELDIKYDEIDKCNKDTAANNIRRVVLKQYLGVYVNFDGFPSDLGGELVYNYSDYDKLLNTLLVGDMSSMTSYNGGRLKPYVGFKHFRGKWENVRPTCVSCLPRTPDTNYDYLYDDGKWYWREVGMYTWRPLTKGLVRKYSWKRY